MGSITFTEFLVSEIGNSDGSVATLERIAVAELADELGCRKQSLFKVIDRLGITTMKRRDPDRGNQLVATVTATEALAIKAEFITRRKANGDAPDGEADQLIADEGMFYLIQLEPEHDPGRIKVGFTTDLDGRLQKHRCSAPFAQYIKSWPCRRTWEKAAIDCLTNGLEQLHTEVFRAVSLDEVASRGDTLFRLMPQINSVVVPGSDDMD